MTSIPPLPALRHSPAPECTAVGRGRASGAQARRGGGAPLARAPLARALVGALLGAALPGCGASAPAAPTGLLLVSIDSLRADHLSCYGYRSATRPELPTTPTLDRLLAAEGVLFEEVVSTTSWTLPAHLALLSGQPDDVHGVRDLPDRLGSDGPELLAEAFAAAGWRTFGLWSGPNLHPWFGFDRGFEHYDDCSAGTGAELGRWLEDGAASRAQLLALQNASHRGPTGERVVAAFERRLAEIAPQQRFFAFVHLWDVHYDYEAPPAFDLFFPDSEHYRGPLDGQGFADYGRRFALEGEAFERTDLERLLSLYDAEIRYTDHNLGRMFAALDRAGRLDRTLVVVTADHGEEFLDHTTFGHKNGLYEEVLRIPLLLRLPGTLPAGVRIAGLVGLVDVAPTVAELCAVPFGPVFGQSLRPAIEAGRAEPRPQPIELLSRGVGLDMRGVRAAGWKSLRIAPEEPLRVVDLRADPGEKRLRTLEADDPRLRTTVQLWEQLDERARAFQGAAPGELPEELREALRRSGYLEDDP
jgi:arylsulfatase A-like enzyme